MHAQDPVPAKTYLLFTVEEESKETIVLVNRGVKKIIVNPIIADKIYR